MTSVALLFPGQGAQAVGMGQDLFNQFPQARQLLTQANEIVGFELTTLCFEGPAEQLTRTEFCQPALYVTSMAAWVVLQNVLQEQGLSIHPVAAGGLSLGEYTALAAAGAVSFEDGLRLVRLRGQAMEAASRLAPGTMASVLGLDVRTLETICVETGAQVANINSPGQIVISGSVSDVQAASEKAKQKGAKRVIPLEVGGAFHSRLMEPAAEKLKLALENVPIHEPKFQVVSNVTGSYHSNAAQIRQLLVDQLTRPVQWVACMQTYAGSGIRTFLELGSGTVLKGLTRKIDPEASVFSVGTADQIRDLLSQWTILTQ